MQYMSIFRRGVARSRGTPRRRGAFRALLKKLDAKPEIACLNLPYKTPKHKVMPPRCLPLRAACGEKLTCSACVSRAARDDLIVKEPRASRIARRGRRRGRRRATNALGGAGATASSHDFSRLVALLDEQRVIDGPDRVVLTVCLCPIIQGFDWLAALINSEWQPLIGRDGEFTRYTVIVTQETTV